jgi:hypothetical protein
MKLFTFWSGKKIANAYDSIVFLWKYGENFISYFNQIVY